MCLQPACTILALLVNPATPLHAITCCSPLRPFHLLHWYFPRLIPLMRVLIYFGPHRPIPHMRIGNSSRHQHHVTSHYNTGRYPSYINLQALYIGGPCCTYGLCVSGPGPYLCLHYSQPPLSYGSQPAPARPTFTGICTCPMTHFCVGF